MSRQPTPIPSSIPPFPLVVTYPDGVTPIYEAGSQPQVGGGFGGGSNAPIGDISTATFHAERDNGTCSTTATIDFSQAQNQRATLGAASCHLTLVPPPGVGHVQLKLIQDGSGSRLVTWAPVHWATAAPTLSTASGAVDVIGLYWDGSAWFGSALVNFSTPDSTPPGQPTGLTVSPGLGQLNLYGFSATDNVGVDHYVIYAAVHGGTLAQVGTTTSAPATVSGLTDGTSYDVAVAAVDAAGNVSALSATATATPGSLSLTRAVVGLIDYNAFASSTGHMEKADFGVGWAGDTITFSSGLVCSKPGYANAMRVFDSLTSGLGDQVVQTTLAATTDNRGPGLIVRAQSNGTPGSSGNANGYYYFRIDTDTSTWYCGLNNNGAYGDQGGSSNAHTFAVGDVLMLSAVGTTITAWINGTRVAQFTDATYATGYAGVRYEPTQGQQGGSWTFPQFFCAKPIVSLLGPGIDVVNLPSNYYARISDGSSHVDSTAGTGSGTKHIDIQTLKQTSGAVTIQIYLGNPAAGGTLLSAFTKTNATSGDSWTF